MYIVVYFVLFLQITETITADKVAKFFKMSVSKTECTDMPSLANKRARSNLDCATACSDEDDCKKYMFCDDGGGMGTCVLFKLNQQCLTTSLQHNCTCRVKKSVRVDKSACICYAGFYGNCCENVIQDCQQGTTIPGISNILVQLSFIQPPLASQPFEVFCVFIPETTTVLMTRNDLSCTNHFNKTWDLYKNGFGGLTTGYWLGLEHMYLLLQTPGRSHTIKFIMDGGSTMCTSIYPDFSLGDESSNYSLNLGSLLLTASRCSDTLSTGILSALGRPFSTFDHYSGLYDCPQTMQSGWWFADDPGCTDTNINGPLMLGTTRATWNPDFTGDEYILGTNIDRLRISVDEFTEHEMITTHLAMFIKKQH